MARGLGNMSNLESLENWPCKNKSVQQLHTNNQTTNIVHTSTWQTHNIHGRIGSTYSDTTNVTL